MRVLVTGAGGQVGSELCSLAADGLEWLPRGKGDLDITNDDAVARALDASAPGAVVNAAAYTAVDKAEQEPDLAHRVNELAPGILAHACARRGIPLVHLSTDFVFDGTKGGPYVEDDPVCPRGVYAISKARGEDRVRQTLPAHAILRVSWVYSPRGKTNFPSTMLRIARERETLRVVTDQKGNPTPAWSIAAAVAETLRQLSSRGKAVYGTYHFSGMPPVSRYEWTRALLETATRFGMPARKVEPVTSDAYPTAVPRPVDSSMDCSRIRRVLGITAPSWMDDLQAFCAARLR